MEFKASLGLTYKVVTGLLTLMFIVIICFLIRVLFYYPHSVILTTIFVFSIVTIVFIYLAAFVNSPLKYIIDHEKISIVSRAKIRIVPLKNIKDVFLLKEGSLEPIERTGGNRGLFGFYGDFKTAFGPTTAYATRLNNYLMIQAFDGERILLTPDDKTMVKEIIKLIRQKYRV